MFVLHDGFGFVTGLQVFPQSTELPHIVVSDELFDSFQQLIGANFQLENVNGLFSIPDDIAQKLELISIEKNRAEKLAQIEVAQMAELQQGVAFLFNGMPDTIQTRSERDLINISGIATKAILLKGKGIEEAVIEFRAESNTSYMITPDDAIALGEAVADRNQQIYSKAWQLKDAISAAQTTQELELLQW